jgi:hypothetical protein
VNQKNIFLTSQKYMIPGKQASRPLGIRGRYPQLGEFGAVAGDRWQPNGEGDPRCEAASSLAEEKKSFARVEIAATRSQIPQILTHFIAFVNSIFCSKSPVVSSISEARSNNIKSASIGMIK